jgi:biopolymer transport protein ExbD
MAMHVDDGGGRKKRGPQPNINVTPLVDVVLVLLIIFMLVIPNMQEGKTIEMVKVDVADELADQTEPLVVTIDRNEVFTLGQADMARSEVIAALQAAHAKNPRQRVLLRGDASLPYVTVREFFHEVQRMGFASVALAVGVVREWSEDEGEG